MLQLLRQWHCWAAMCGKDKRWKHLSAKPFPRWVLPEEPWKTTTLIGCGCKHSNVFSLTILMLVRLYWFRSNNQLKKWVYFTTICRIQRIITGTFSKDCSLTYWRQTLVARDSQFYLLYKFLKASRVSHSGDLSAAEPPVPIPNTEVKRCSPDGSASIGCARVGRRQY